MNLDSDITVTIPAHLRGWVLDGLSSMMNGLRDEVMNMEEYPEEYSWKDRQDAETTLCDLSYLYDEVAGR